MRAIIAVIAVAATVVMAYAASPVQADADKRKADYYFMEAMRQNALDHKDAYYELLRRAYTLDRGNSDVSFLTGLIQVLIGGNDSTLMAQGYRLIASHVNREPSDIYAGNVFANLNAHIGRPQVAREVWRILDSIYPDKVEISVNYADALAASPDSADRDRSLAVYSRIETAEGKSPQVSSRKVGVMMQQRDTAAVIAEIDTLLKALPRSAEARVFAGSVYSMLGNRDSAIHYFDEACDVDPSSGMAYYARANFYKDTSNPQAYDREVFRALKQENLDLDTKMQLLTGYVRALYSDSTQQPRIEELFKVLIDQHPHEVDIHDLFSSYYVAIKNFPAAIEQVGYAVDIDPADEERWRMLMSLYAHQQEWPHALSTARTALKYHPRSVDLNMLAGIYMSQDSDFTGAMRYFDTALALADTVSPEAQGEVLTAMGDAMYKSGQPDSAFVYYDRALTLDPGNLLAMNNCAYFLACENRDLDRAERMSAMVIREKPTESTSLDTYAWVLFKKGEYAKARDYIDTALANDADGPSEELLHHAGDIYFMSGDPDKALEFWTQALTLAPDNELLRRKVTHKTYFYK